jgi:hypothetical protein
MHICFACILTLHYFPLLLSELSCLVRGGPAFGGPGVSPRSDAALVIRFDFLLFEPLNFLQKKN